MTDRYEPPEGTDLLTAVAVLCLIMGAVCITLSILVNETSFALSILIGCGATLVVVALIFLLLCHDLKSPNGKFTLVKSWEYHYDLKKRKNVHPKDTPNQDIKKE